ncbi:hypothetical protein LEA11_22870, partial [Salmonella enterica]|nr:hypothetical protein [Salmonella enterica]
ATTDLSVRFCDACQGGGAYGKPAAAHPFFPSCIHVFPRHVFIRESVPLAAAERPSVASQ